MGGRTGRGHLRAVSAATARRVVPHLGGRTAALALKGAGLVGESQRGTESLAREARRRLDAGDIDRGGALAEVVVAHRATTPALRSSVRRAEARALVRAGRPHDAVAVLERWCARSPTRPNPSSSCSPRPPGTPTP